MAAHLDNWWQCCFAPPPAARPRLTARRRQARSR